MIFQKAHSGDVAAIERIELRSFSREEERFHRRQIASLVANPRAIVLIAHDDSGAHLGWGAALVRRHRTRPSGRIYAVAVDPDGRGMGVGKQLMAKMMEQLRRRGARRIFLEVRADNATAIGLYRKLGFVEIGMIDHYYAPGLHAMRMVIEVMQPVFQPLGDAALRVGLADQADLNSHRRVQAFCKCLEDLSIPGVVEWVGAYTSVTIFYRPWRIDYDQLCLRLSDATGDLDDLPVSPGRLVTLPVCYGGDFGPDIGYVAQTAGLTVTEVVELHSKVEYLVCMMGFAPGFGYLLGLPPRLATPRLDTPRLAVPEGSVGIGGSQTGVYPIRTPGGWRIIGHTPVKLYDPAAANPFLLSPGDRVRFSPVTAEEHAKLTGIGIRKSGFGEKRQK